MRALADLRARARQLARLMRLAWGFLRLRRASDEAARGRARQALAALMADSRGLSAKIGQVMSSGAAGEPFAELQDRLPALPLEEILPPLERALGGPSDQFFAQLLPAQAAASIGQVHKAILRDGRPAAVKVQYPGIGSAIELELGLAGMAPAGGPIKTWGFDLQSYKLLLRDNLHRELDYRSEAERQQRFSSQVQVSGLRVPEIYPDLCRKTVLVQSWEEGEALSAAAQWPLRERLLTGKTLLETFFVSLFAAGEIHADPHPGNMFFRRHAAGPPSVVLLDFGCTLEIDRQRRLALLRLLLGLRAQEAELGWRTLGALGFDSRRLAPIGPQLDLLCSLLLEPFLVDRPFDLSEWRCAERSAELLGELRWWFRAAAPADFLLLVRAFSGLATQLQELEVSLPWWPILQNCLPPALLGEAATYELPALPADLAHDGGPAAARFLKVRVSRAGEELVAMTLPAIEALDLPTLMPEDVRQAVVRRGIDLPSLVDRVRAQKFAPQELFHLESGPKEYRVWIE